MGEEEGEDEKEISQLRREDQGEGEGSEARLLAHLAGGLRVMSGGTSMFSCMFASSTLLTPWRAERGLGRLALKRHTRRNKRGGEEQP